MSNQNQKRNKMKTTSTIITLFFGAFLCAQEMGNYQSTMGNFDGVNAISNGTTVTATCSGNMNAAANAVAAGGTAAYDYSWNASTQSRQYYNPYTGQYENAPVAGKDNATAALPYDNSVIFD